MQSPSARGLALLLSGAALAAEPVNVPPDYQLVYEQHFDTPESLLGLAVTDTRAWRHAADGRNLALELHQQSTYKPKVRSPFNMALVADRQFGDFVLEIDLMQTGREYGHRDMCLFFGLQDPAHFYYVHLATSADDHAHNVFVVNGAPRAKIARETTSGVQWGQNVWRHVRLERRLGDGSIRVFWEDMERPIMVAEDKTFGAGWVGVGSFDDVGKVDNLRIWSPTAPEARTAAFFGRGTP